MIPNDCPLEKNIPAENHTGKILRDKDIMGILH